MQKTSVKLTSILTNPIFSHAKLSNWKTLTFFLLRFYFCVSAFWGIYYIPKQQNAHQIFLWYLRINTRVFLPKLSPWFLHSNNIKHSVILNQIKALNILSTRAALISIYVAVLHMEGKSVLTCQLEFDFCIHPLARWLPDKLTDYQSSTIMLGKQEVVYLE